MPYDENTEKHLQKLDPKCKGWGETWAKIIPRAEGKCEYCGLDLVEDFYRYQTAVHEHLLFKEGYPELKDNPDNAALSCTLCNNIKGEFEPLDEGEDPREMISREEKRKELIQRVQDYIAPELEERKRMWEKVKKACEG